MGVAVGVMSVGTSGVTVPPAVAAEGKLLECLEERLDDREEEGETGFESEEAGRSREIPEGCLERSDFPCGGKVAIDDPNTEPEPDAEAPDEATSLTNEEFKLGEIIDDRSGSMSRPKLEVDPEGSGPICSADDRLCGKINPEGAAVSSMVVGTSPVFASVAVKTRPGPTS